LSSFFATKLDIPVSENPRVGCSLLTGIQAVGRAGESQAQSLVGADSALSDGLSLSDFVDRKRELPSVFQSMFFRYWLGMAVVELTLRVDISLVVLVALWRRQ
jgi:hypothetical protein